MKAIVKCSGNPPPWHYVFVMKADPYNNSLEAVLVLCRLHLGFGSLGKTRILLKNLSLR